MAAISSPISDRMVRATATEKIMKGGIIRSTANKIAVQVMTEKRQPSLNCHRFALRCREVINVTIG